jgi:nucleotide-binding universal stress UspA family protein
MGGIVVGYVSSPEGHAAIRQGIAEARLRGVPLHVVWSERGRDLDGPTAVAREHELAEVDAEVERAGVPHEVHHLVRGKDPVTDLIEAAQEIDADLVVIGIRKRTPVGKLVLGSHAQAILLDSPYPVLAVKA